MIFYPKNPLMFTLIQFLAIIFAKGICCGEYVAEETAKKSKPSNVLPWETAKAELNACSDDRKVKEIGDKAAKLTLDKTGYDNPVIAELQKADIPITVSGEGIYAGAVKPSQAPDMAFADPERSQKLALIAKGDAKVTFLPITSANLRKHIDPYEKSLIFDAPKATVVDNSNMPRRYVVGAGKMLALTMPLPQTRMPVEEDILETPGERHLIPIKAKDIKIQGEYYPERSVHGLIHPEMNYIKLPNGTVISMQKGAKLELSYGAGDKAVKVLAYEAGGAAKFDRTAEAKKTIKDMPVLLKVAGEKLQKIQKEYDLIDRKLRDKDVLTPQDKKIAADYSELLTQCINQLPPAELGG